MSFKNFWVEVVTFSHIKMTDNVIDLFVKEHVLVEGDLVKVLIIFFVFEVVHNRQFGWTIFQQYLNGY